MNRLDFENRTAVVTGGAAGIGLAIARRFAASGARVALWDRDARVLDVARSVLGGDSYVYALDVSNADAVDRVTRETTDALGAIDALVCSAGITGPNTVTWEYPVEDWRK